MRFTSRNPIEPRAGTWRMMSAPSVAGVRLSPPPANDSPATAAELAELRTMAKHRTAADIQQIRRWAVNESSVTQYWVTVANLLASRYHLSPPAATRLNYVLTAAMHGAMVAAWDAKYQHLRPRPSTLDPRVDASVVGVPDHPAYPSGHSTAAGAASAILSRFFPADAGLFEALAQDAGMSRLKAAVHYRSDHTGGMQLGRHVAGEVYRSIVDRDGGPKSYTPVPGTRRLTFPEVIAMLDCQGGFCERRS